MKQLCAKLGRVKKRGRRTNVNEKCFASMKQSSGDRSVFDTSALMNLVYLRVQNY